MLPPESREHSDLHRKDSRYQTIPEEGGHNMSASGELVPMMHASNKSMERSPVVVESKVQEPHHSREESSSHFEKGQRKPEASKMFGKNHMEELIYFSKCG